MKRTRARVSLALLAVCAAAVGAQVEGLPALQNGPAARAPRGRPAPPPGAEPWPAALATAIEQAAAATDATERSESAGPDYVNRLLLEASGYLREHASDPIDWRPWGDEAFAAARRLGRPVLLSIGYATCHWCHVLRSESFADPQFARRVNERYVAVLVDREERPEVDAAYQAAAELLGERGGWPLTLWLTPEGVPFYAAGYLPRRDGERGFELGFETLLVRLADSWRSDRRRLERSAGGLAALLRSESEPAPTVPGAPDWPARFDRAVARLLAIADPTEGGLIGAPKFPLALPVRVLLRAHRASGDPQALALAERTLERLAAGTLRDPIGGGFHRYATDAQWLLPHFEKPLADNARLVLAYLEAFAATGNPDYAAVARETLAFLTRELRRPDGLFATALDADSPGSDGVPREGAFYGWSDAALDAALAPAERRAWRAVYGLAPLGEGGSLGAPFAARPKRDAASALGVRVVALESDLARARTRLADVRERRVRPARDETVVVSGNALAISALARGAFALDAPEWAEGAAAAATELLSRAHRGGRLLHLATSDGTPVAALLNDYALLVAALLDLHEATGELRWLATARSLTAEMIAAFADPERRGFRRTREELPLSLARPSAASDDLGPSGNAVAALDLLRLAAWTGEADMRARAEETLAALALALDERPEGCGELLLAVDFLRAAPAEIVIVTPGPRATARPFLAELRKRYLPHRVLTVIPEGELADAAATAPLVAGRRALDGRATAYLCRRFACQRPTPDPVEFGRQLDRIEPRASPESSR